MSKFDYKVHVYSKDSVRLSDCYASVAVRLINKKKAVVLKMINDNGKPKVLSIKLLHKTAEEVGINSLENKGAVCNE